MAKTNIAEVLSLPRRCDIVDEPFAPVECLLCDQTFDLGCSQNFLRHLLVDHKFVIGDVNLIWDLGSYINYWKNRFKDFPTTEAALLQFCTVMKTNTGEHDVFESEFYYFLCDTVPEDRQLREHLNHMRLDVILENQERDRSRTDFHKMCLFCSAEFNGGYDQVKEFFNHMSEKHHFNVGHPDNMVFIDDFIESIRGRLDGLQCLSCTKCFKDRTTLKDHMRKKSHRALNKEDRSFDKFYLVNYLELGKRWTQLNQEEDSDNEETWQEIGTEPIDQHFCFFCEEVFSSYDKLITHLYEKHDFEYEKIKEQLKMSYYEQFKFVNWIRMEKFKHETGKLDVMEITERILAKEWNQPQYYFPTYQDDAVLTTIEDTHIQDNDELYVFPETLEHPEDIRNNSILKHLVVDIVEKDHGRQHKYQRKQKRQKPKQQPVKKNQNVQITVNIDNKAG